MSCGQAQTVGLLPVFGAFSISSYNRGLPLAVAGRLDCHDAPPASPVPW